MAQRQTGFGYRNIELYKSESLGSGSYGGVCRAKCDGVPCAAKIMHPTLFDMRDTGSVSYLRKFREECHLLSLVRHPNVVQYLATYYDPDTRLPVLLMELCDESLTAFLERSPEPVSYNIQINICHDITLALVYLHSNGLIHRDLTGNNVLMVAGTRAKITDFGMSKLATINARMTALTMCPGNVLYMPPEALDEVKTYTDKLDIFSFGVIIIQILTSLFPNPTDRFRLVSVPQFEEALRQIVPETERRQSHIKLIPDTHTLKPLALQCLNKKENERPSALQFSDRLSEIKQSSQYTKSMFQIQSSIDIQQMLQQLRNQNILMETKTREIHQHQTRNTELQSLIEHKDGQLREKQHTIQEKLAMIQTKDRQLQAKDRELQEKDRQLQTKDRQLEKHIGTIASREHTVEMKERELQQTQQRLQISEKLVSQLQQQKKQATTDLQQTMPSHMKKTRQLEQQDTVRGDKPQQSLTKPQTKVATAQKDIYMMTWREGKNAPQKMFRGAAVVYGNKAYFRPDGLKTVYSYQNILGEEQWSQLPDNISNENFDLAVIDDLLTSVGGANNGYTNTLLSLTGEDDRKQWSEIFPPMPTPRESVACITTRKALVVAGGYAGVYLDTVEVMNINTKQWTTAYPLPQKQAHLSATVCGDTLYFAGGYNVGYRPSKSVLTCSLPDLLPSTSLGSRLRRRLSISLNVWKEISNVPVVEATLVSFNGHLLAIGGCNNSGNTTNDVYRYDSNTDSWNVVSQMKNNRSSCLAVIHPNDQLIVLGGFRESFNQSDSVEILK